MAKNKNGSNDSDMVMLTGLWLNEAKDGSKFMAGQLGNARVLLFKNKNKKGEKSPDYFLFLASPHEKSDEDKEGDDNPFEGLL